MVKKIVLSVVLLAVAGFLNHLVNWRSYYRLRKRGAANVEAKRRRAVRGAQGGFRDLPRDPRMLSQFPTSSGGRPR